MVSRETVSAFEASQAHPRRPVEILDDAWRICFSEPLLLLTLTFLFHLPAATCLVVLLVQPAPVGPERLLLPALTALLLPLTGLSAAACQEAFYSWSENYAVGFGECLKAACKRGPHVVASQAITLIGPMVVLTCWLMPGLPAGIRGITVVQLVLITGLISLFGLTRQPSFAAGNPRFWRTFRYSMRAVSQHFGAAWLLAVMRGLLWLFAIFNLHLMGSFALWAAEHLGGFDVAYLGVLFSLDNAAYFLTLVLLARCLLSPFSEAVNYLFFMDVRTRTEGLDLWNRVEDQFPASKRIKAGAILLAVGLGLLSAGSASAQEPLTAVKTARQDIGIIRDEVKVAEPYPGSKRWLPRLEKIGDKLDKSGAKPGGYQWFRLAVEDFANRDQKRAVELLDDLDVRLALLEDSLSRPRKGADGEEPSTERLKSLIPPEKSPSAKRKSQKIEEAKDNPKDRKPVKDPDEVHGDGGGIRAPTGPGMLGPIGLGGAANVLLIILIGLGAAVLVAGVAIVVYKLWQERVKATPVKAGVLPMRTEEYLEDPDKQDPSLLWRQADERAKAGDYLGAVRILYLAVLALLHQGGFIRYERTRTNGEYVDQLRRRSLLHGPFLGMTGLFEVKWYGERACAPDDYRRCRELAEEVRTGSKRPEPM